MSRDNPRSDEWAEWYSFHPQAVAAWGEANGYEPKHEPGCTFDPDPVTPADSRVLCWCNAFCGYCDHHTDHHQWDASRDAVPCSRCPDEICLRDRTAQPN